MYINLDYRHSILNKTKKLSLIKTIVLVIACKKCMSSAFSLIVFQ